MSHKPKPKAKRLHVDFRKPKARLRPYASKLRRMYACAEAVEWMRSRPDLRTLEQAWNACTRTDWLWWVAVELGDNRAAQTMQSLDRHYTGYSMVGSPYNVAWRVRTAIRLAGAMPTDKLLDAVYAKRLAAGITRR